MQLGALMAKYQLALEALARYLDLEPADLKVKHRDPLHRHVMTLERLVEALPERQPSLDLDAVMIKIEAIKGVGPSTAEAIRELLADAI